MTTFLIITCALTLIAFVAWRVWAAFTQTITVWDHQHVLHYRHGVLVGTLAAGRHRLTGRGQQVVHYDKRWQQATIQGQEFLTADKAPIKVSGLVRYRIGDPVVFAQASMDAYSTLHGAVQIALRDVIGAAGVEDVLEHKADFGAALLALVKPVAERLGYELDAVLVRDLMLGGDLKRVFTQVMSAKQEALAELEKARGEAAAIRVMANAARVFETSPALLQLRFLDTLEKTGAGYNNQLIMGPLDPLMTFLKH